MARLLRAHVLIHKQTASKDLPTGDGLSAVRLANFTHPKQTNATRCAVASFYSNFSASRRVAFSICKQPMANLLKSLPHSCAIIENCLRTILSVARQASSSMVPMDASSAQAEFSRPQPTKSVAATTKFIIRSLILVNYALG